MTTLRTRLRTFLSAAVLCGGVPALSGCHSQAAGPDAVPIPAPHAAPSPQAQIQEIENNSHIPPAQKASLEADISNRNGAAPSKPPAPP